MGFSSINKYMKTTNYLKVVAVTGAVLAMVPFMANAQVTDVTGATSVGTEVNSGPGSRPPVGAPGMRAKLHNAAGNYDEKIKQAEENGNYRNNLMAESRMRGEGTSTRPMMVKERMVEKRMIGSTTPGMYGSTTPWRNMKDENGDGRPDKFASSTRPWPPRGERRDDDATSTDREYRRNLKEVRKEIFGEMKQRFENQADQALSNLKQIRTRVASRIDAQASTTRDMSEAKGLLAIADAKIALAESAVAALHAYVAPTATSTVSLETPRALGKAAISAIEDARKALKDVVVSIAKSMGYKLGQDGKIEATSTNDR